MHKGISIPSFITKDFFHVIAIVVMLFLVAMMSVKIYFTYKSIAIHDRQLQEYRQLNAR